MVVLTADVFQYFIKRALEHLEAAGPEKKGSFYSFFSKSLPGIYYWSGHIFGASASPRNWLCYPLPLFMAVSMMPNM